MVLSRLSIFLEHSALKKLSDKSPPRSRFRPQIY